MIKARKGHSITLECTGGINITGWKIRAEVYDKDNRIKLANDLSGGNDSQIEVTDAEKGVFMIYVPKGATSKFKSKKAHLVTEFETNDTPVLLLSGPSECIELDDRIIDWDIPA